jgi:hypothetical protein
MSEKLSYAVRPDANGFDEIRIRTVPRYKTSGLSGDEWRISMVTEFYRKGVIIAETQSGSSMEAACGLLYGRLIKLQDDGEGYYAGDGIHCDQEGCSEKATNVFKIKKRFCVGGGNCGQEKKNYGDQHRCFCDKHKTRGDCDLEDNDANYEFVKNI